MLRVADWILWGQLFLDELHREHFGRTTTQKQEWGLFMLEWLLHNVTAMHKTKHWRHSQGSKPETAESAPKHPSVQTLLGSPDKEILEVAEQVYRGELALAPTVLPCQWQDWCMKELRQVLHRCMARVGLQSEIRMARSSSRSRRHLCTHSTSRGCSFSSEHRGTEAAKQLKKDAPTGQSEARRCSHSRGRDRSRHHQSPSP